jgi:hypothetical protein
VPNTTTQQPTDIFPDESNTSVNVQLRIDPTFGSNLIPPPAVGFLPFKMVFSPNFSEDGFSENSGSNYATGDVFGRAENYMTFSGGQNMTIPLEWHFAAADLEEAVHNISRVRALQSLKDPFDGPENLSIPPPPLLLIIGRLLAARVVMTEATVQWKGPFEPQTMIPHHAQVQTTFTVVRNVANQLEPSYTDINTFSQFITFPNSGPIVT